jgi:hypothetical protein
MSENKTKPTSANVEDFINSVDNDIRRQDGFAVLDVMKRVSGEEPVMWGPSIIGFGQYHYKYDSGREGDMCKIGFSPRKANTVLYIMGGHEQFQPIFDRLGKYKQGKSCVYITNLKNVDMDVLEELVQADWDHMTEKYG